MRKISSAFLQLLFSLFAFTHAKFIMGTVIDFKGEPIPFASIKVKNTGAGVAADSSGIFLIRTNGATLVISAEGYISKEIKVDNYDNIIAMLHLFRLQQ